MTYSIIGRYQFVEKYTKCDETSGTYVEKTLSKSLEITTGSDMGYELRRVDLGWKGRFFFRLVLELVSENITLK